MLKITSCFCFICSTSLPGGNQVDGLPPASSTIRDYHKEYAILFLALELKFLVWARSKNFGFLTLKIDIFDIDILKLSKHQNFINNHIQHQK